MKTVSYYIRNVYARGGFGTAGAGATERGGIQFFASGSQPVRVDEIATETNTVPGPLTSATGDGGRAWFKGKDGGYFRSGLCGSRCLRCVDGRKGISDKENSMSRVGGWGPGKNGSKFRECEIQGTVVSGKRPKEMANEAGMVSP